MKHSITRKGIACPTGYPARTTHASVRDFVWCRHGCRGRFNGQVTSRGVMSCIASRGNILLTQIALAGIWLITNDSCSARYFDGTTSVPDPSRRISLRPNGQSARYLETARSPPEAVSEKALYGGSSTASDQFVLIKSG